MKKLLNIYFLAFSITFSFAQQYPVKLIPVVIPPYSLKLGDYATSTDTKLQLQVLMTDLMEPQHQTGIKFSLQAGLNAVPIAQSNDFVLGMQPFTLYPGSNITLTNVDLRALFALQNLGGINASQYAQPLPDGVYQFCFQAYDFYTKRNLSQPTCATVFLTQYDPPMLNLPQNGEKIQAVAPYTGGAGILFQWMPRQIAPNTKYIFTLKELWDLGQSPVSGFLSSPPLWREETYTSTLYYGLDKTQLIPGKRYAWQVQAKSGNPVLGGNPTEDNGVYKNNGLSEIFYFDYVENCAVPTLLMAKNAGRGRVELSWNLAGQASGLYSVQYRKTGSSSQWQTVQSYQPRYIVTGLEDQTEYEYRIGSVCGDLQAFNNTNPVTEGNSAGNAYSFSPIQYFTTDTKDATNQNYQCGVMPAVDITNKNPLQTLLGVNEVFTAGDFPVTVVSAQGNNGIYSGTGYIVVPYLADTKIKVVFNNIKLNTDKKLIEGVIETEYDPNETAVAYASAGLGETFGDAGVKEVNIDFPIGGITYSATPPPGKITITGSDGGGGTGSTIDYPAGKDYQFTDSNKDIWTVDENGTVVKGGKVAEGGKSTPANTDGVDSSGSATAITAKGIKVEFENAPASKYAFDKPTKALTSDYREIDGKFIPFKAVENQKTEPFIAKVTITDTAIKADSLVFKTSKGVAIDTKKVGNQWELTLKGTFSYAKEEVQAVIKQGDKYKVAGVFYLVHISPKTIKLNLVPTNGVNITEQKQKDIKDIYSKVAINVDISVKSPFDISQYLVGSKLPTEDELGDLSTYSDAQNRIISDYKAKNTVGLEYYIFVTDKPSSTGQDGYMRLNGQFGFVFNQSARTIAHELGHGALKLEHPFKQFNITKGSTTGLLDYANGTNFTYTDWKQINDPAFKLYMFQGQSSGESIDKDFVLKEDGYFLTPSNKLIKLVKGTEISFYCEPPQSYQNTVLHGFKTPDGFHWDNTTKYQLNQKIFDGYYKVKKDKTGWEKDNLGNRILFADTNYKYNGAGKYPVYYILWVNLGNNKSQYKIYKGELDIKNDQLATNKNFEGTIQNVNSFSNSSLVETITSTGCQPMIEDKGDFIDTITDTEGKYEIKIYKSKDGKFLTEFKFKKNGNAKTKDQKEAIERQVETAMNEKLQKIGSLQGLEKGFKDEAGFYVADMTGKQWLTTIADLGTSVWENSALPENYWNEDKGSKTSNVRMPALFTGVSDGVIDQVTGYQQLVKLGYDVVTKEEVRSGIWNAVKNISPSSVYSLAEGIVKDKIEKYNFSDKPYLGNHEIGKDGVAVISLAMGAGFITKGDDALEKGVKDTGDKIKDAIKKKLGDIEKDMTTPEFIKKLEDAFGRYKSRVGDLALSKIDWENKYKTLYKNREIGKLTEKEFELLEGGFKPSKGISTSDGKRYFDNVLDGTAREVKSGSVTLSKYKEQILKDIDIINNDLAKGVDKIEWHCFDEVNQVEIEKFVHENLRTELRDKGLFKIIKH